MSKLELSWEALHRFNPALKFSVYRSGIEEFADEASATEAKNRWANIGREIILAKIKLYCLQDIHVNLAGFEAIEEESVTSVYAALYQQLIACFNNAKTSDKSLRRRRVDRLIGFLAAEIDSGMVGQFLTPTILKESVRQILPAEEALKRYEKKNPGLLGRKVTVITSGVHVRLEFRQRSAVGEGLDVKEAESIAQERLADLLYDGELPTLRATYPQTSRQMHEPTEKMLKWAQIFNISDDLVSRILILDARNETMDSLIESIGHNLCAAYCYSNPDSDFSESASDAVKSLVKAVIHLPKLAEAPFLLIGRQRDIQIQPRILNRMFFYLSPIGGEANSHFAFILNSVAKKSSPVKTDTTEDKILPIPRSAISHDHEEQTPQRREVTPVFKPARQETVTQETVTRAQAGISGFKPGLFTSVFGT